MADTIDVDDLVKELTKACRTYTDDVKQKVHKGIRRNHQEARKNTTEILKITREADVLPKKTQNHIMRAGQPEKRRIMAFIL